MIVDIQMPNSPSQAQRASVPPFLGNVSREAYKASPLARALTPPPPVENSTPFPSIESINSYSTHAPSHVHSFSGSSLQHTSTSSSSYPGADTSPIFSAPVQIYCANCRQLSLLKDSYACTECISGFCGDCMYVLSGGNAGHVAKPCPRCRMEGVRYRPFQLDLR